MSGAVALTSRPADQAQAAFAAALAGLPRIDPRRLVRLLSEAGSPAEAWRRLSGDPPAGDGRPRWDSALWASWRRHSAVTDPKVEFERYQRRDIQVLVKGFAGYPARLADNPEGPAVLFALGDLAVLDQPTVALVGTRRCTGYGRQVAQMLGRRLAHLGVVVVSGLAVGIDAEAQAGALGSGGAPVVGVAGTGLDSIYPDSSRPLWERIAQEGLLLSETALGGGFNPLRFSWRNRVMAGLADVVVVVESDVRGGSLSTVAAAMRLGVSVAAVPGPVNSPQSAGTNALITDGAALIRDALDVQAALGLARPGPRLRASDLVDSGRPRGRTGPTGEPTPLPAEANELLSCVDATPTSLDTLMARTGWPTGRIALLLDGLEEAGLVESGEGWWQRRIT